MSSLERCPPSVDYVVHLRKVPNRVLRYLFNYFNVRSHDIHHYKTGNNDYLILEKVNIECTKRAFFYKGTKNFNNS